MDRTAGEVLDTAVELARDQLGDRLRAAFALGSLAHGGFEPAVSDVDLALIAEDSTQREIDQITARTQQKSANALAQRLSIFWSDWPSLATERPAGRFPATDRLDLIDHGALLFGVDRRTECSRPTHDQLVADSREFATTRFRTAQYRELIDNPETLVRQGQRAVTKAVLFPARIAYTTATGALGRNDDAANWYVAQRLPGSELVGAAARWRSGGIDDDATALLRRHLANVYQEMFDLLEPRSHE
jgi:hypothetical protein